MRLSKIRGVFLLALSFNSMSVVAQAQNTTTRYQYDAVGNLTQTTDSLSHVTKQEFNLLNQNVKTIDAKNGITQYGYDGNSRLTKVVDARNLATSYTIDGLGNLMATLSPDTGLVSMTHDEAGNIKTRTDAKGQTTTYAYDALSRLTMVSYSDGSNEVYLYDQGENGIGHLSQITDITGTTYYSYDIYGKITREVRKIGGQDYTTGYHYGPTGQLNATTYPSGRVINYEYDNNGRVTSITTIKNGITTKLVSQVQYQPFGGLRSMLFGNGQHYARTYDQDGRVISYTLDGVVNILSYDAANRLIGVNDQMLPFNNRSYDYDELNRLTREQRANSSIGYSYDSVGNRTQKNVGGALTLYSYATNSNRLIKLEGMSITSDANGSISNNGTASFTYDARGRMNSADTAVGRVGYMINALGQRVQKVTPQGSTIFHFNTEGQLIAENDLSSFTEYIYLDGIPVAMLISTSDNVAVYYIHTDQIDTPRVLSNQAGRIVWRWDGDDFGYAAPNEQPDGQPAVRMNLRWPGQYFDRETNLHYNYYRDYDPNVGRYGQSDPIGLKGGVNTYAYVDSNPTTFTDPFGLKKKFSKNHPHCVAIRGKMTGLQNELDNRWGELVGGLVERIGPGEGLAQTMRGHRKLINKADTSLRKWEKQYDEDCNDDADNDEDADSCQVCPSGTTVMKTAAGVGTAYFAYRCVRMLPSLLPPFWWTIPANGAIP